MQASNSAPDIDEEGQRYLDVQRRAAAVQLYSRSLAIAHLRAQLVLPRGATVAVKQPPPQLIKQEGGGYQGAQQARPAALYEAAEPMIRIAVSTTPADLPQQPAAAQQQQHPQQGKQNMLKPRPLVHKLPDAAAAQRFRAGELPDEEPGGAGLAAAKSEAAAAAALAPRIVADSGQLGHQLAGWVRVAAGEGGEAEGGMGEAEGMEEEGLVGHEAPEPEDMMDEEEWV